MNDHERDQCLKVIGELQSLKDKHEIYDLMIENGVTGSLGDGYHCPLAAYIKSRVGLPQNSKDVIVEESQTHLYEGEEYDEVSYLRARKLVDNSNAMSSFVQTFDGGYWDKLIDQ